MTTLILGIWGLLFFLSILIGLLVAVIYAIRKFPLHALVIGVTLAASGTLLIQYLEKQRQLSIVPEGMPIENVLYVQKDYREFYEPVIIVYELPESVAREIQKEGLGYFAKLPNVSVGRYDRHGCCSHWDATPIVGNRPEDFFPDVRAYLNRSGFEGRIDPAIEREINIAVSKRGAYYARDNSGTFLVIPGIRKIIYVRNG